LAACDANSSIVSKLIIEKWLKSDFFLTDRIIGHCPRYGLRHLIVVTHRFILISVQVSERFCLM
jgi:hypothetical protein